MIDVHDHTQDKERSSFPGNVPSLILVLAASLIISKVLKADRRICFRGSYAVST